ncbi:carbohydrate ABC transporter permease [Kineosporia babensis]|uniref:Carbohydrate ABC transporter permease n=1 Tax=Kineosporia babensis TaxID=499548 RepID=A0A9X1NFD7_9ACTN|nr:carbohydrate ABC transporter permease [Kineosporia babensis]MCD5312078.1 carbohydrate ABC transporter permease [Kineosporia babensis]
MTQTTLPPQTEPARPAPQRPTGRNGDRGAAVTSHSILGVWTLVVLAPLLWTVLQSFKTSQEIFASPFALPERWSFDNYVSAWTTAGIGSYFLNTVLVVGSALFLTMLLGSMSAYALARFEFPGRTVIRQLILAGLTFPIFLAVVPLFFVLQGMGLLGTLPGLILTYTAFAYPFTVFFLISYFEELPSEIAEAAAIDGASAWRTFFQIMLPMARPGMASVAILNFVGLWNQFLLPLVLNTDQSKWVLTQGMAAFASSAGYSVDFGALFAGAVMTILPVLVVYIIFQRRLQGSVAQGSLK